MKHVLQILLLFSSISFATAQTVISGRVTDGVSGDPLPYVTIRGTNINTGAVSDFDGYYTIRTDVRIDSIVADYMGYESVRKAVVHNQKQTIDFSLNEAASTFSEFVVKPSGINPADRIMKQARKRKKEYNPEKIEFYEYEAYSKVQLAVDNVTDKFKKRKIFKAMEPLFDTVSSFSDTSSKKVLPVFVSETVSDYYYRKFPRRTKEVIKATKLQGVGVGDESYVSQILGSTFQQYNFYENNLYILDKDFISPLSTQAASYYYFNLRDSLAIDGKPCYQIQVDPKNPKDLVFRGMIWITAHDYAIKRLSLEITREANLNFIEKLKIQQEFTEVEPTYWLPNKTRVLIDIAELTNNTLGMIGLYYNSAKDIKINNVQELPFYEEKISVDQSSFDKTELYWDTARHEQITTEDKKIYQMVDSLKNQPLVKTYIDIVEIIVEGHIPANKIELGPYYYLLGFNQLEGIRTRLGFRTSPAFSEDFAFRAYGAYGFKDEQFKYGAFADYVISRKKWAKIGAYVKNDVELIGLTDEDQGTTAVFEAFAMLGTDRLNRSFVKRVWFEKELAKGYTQNISLTHKSFQFEEIGKFNFGYVSNQNNPANPEIKTDYDITSINLRGRLSHKEQFIYRRTNRYSLGNLKAPVLSLDYTKSFKDILGGDFNFDQVGLELWQFNSLGNIGTFEYTIKAYKTFGNAPYPSLFVMQGNESFFSNKRFYNMMNYFEFAADQYVSLDYEHQFNGLIMNRIPLAKRFKLRSFINTKAVYGGLSTSNQSLMPKTELGYTNPNFFVNGKPYLELGYGIENILRFIRVDFIHRITYLDKPGAKPFGVKGTAVIRF
ncbi:MAG: carboxypeptidase-like regulatory domain-containing protein [Bacteroidia bacterium]|nr:carboxypeptidase-like regulatory domain-containing protein [Bacteroidia bacterium]